MPPGHRRADCRLRRESGEAWSTTMATTTTLHQFRAPLGGEEIALQQLEHDGGGMALLRVRIRERSRFTVFDIDPQTAMAWGEAMRRWGEAQRGTPEAAPDA